MDSKMKLNVSQKIAQILQDLQTTPDAWIDLARVESHPIARNIPYKQYGFPKLKPFLREFFSDILEFEDKYMEGKPPVSYIRLKRDNMKNSSETKNKKFIRLAEAHMEMRLDCLQKLDNLSNRINYEYSNKQTKQMFFKIYSGVAKIKAHFMKKRSRSIQIEIKFPYNIISIRHVFCILCVLIGISPWLLSIKSCFIYCVFYIC